MKNAKQQQKGNKQIGFFAKLLQQKAKRKKIKQEAKIKTLKKKGKQKAKQNKKTTPVKASSSKELGVLKLSAQTAAQFKFFINACEKAGTPPVEAFMNNCPSLRKNPRLQELELDVKMELIGKNIRFSETIYYATILSVFLQKPKLNVKGLKKPELERLKTLVVNKHLQLFQKNKNKQ